MDSRSSASALLVAAELDSCAVAAAGARSQHDFFEHAIRIMTLMHDAKMIALLPNENVQRFRHCASCFVGPPRADGKAQDGR
jgi:hypothetical protein